MNALDLDRMDDLARRLERILARERADGPLPFSWFIWVWFAIGYVCLAAITALGELLLLALVAAFLSWITDHVPAIISLATLMLLALSAMLSSNLREFVIPGMREQAWRRAVTREYFSWQCPPVTFQEQRYRNSIGVDPMGAFFRAITLWRIDAVSWLRWRRTPLFRWAVYWINRIKYSPRGADYPAPQGRERLIRAQYWARTQEVCTLFPPIALLTAFFSVTTSTLWGYGIIHGDTESMRSFLAEPGETHQSDKLFLAAIYQAWFDYLWQMVNLVPVLGLTDTLSWSRPATFIGDPLQTVLVLSFRLLFAVIAISYLARLFRSDRQLELDINERPSAGILELVLAEEMAKRGRLFTSTSGRRNKYRSMDVVIDSACRRLRASGILPPHPYQYWSRAALTNAIANEQRMWRIG